MADRNVLYDIIGTGYNSTRQADPYIADKLFQFLSPRSDGLYLDIGCGTGNYTVALANKGLSFYGVEPSDKMLEIARSQDGRIKWFNGKAESLPADDTMFDGVIATLTIHHWTDLEKAFYEIYRVLKQDGKLVIFTATTEQMEGYWLNHYFPKMLDDSMIQMPSFNNIKEAITEAGLAITSTEKYFIRDDQKDLFLYAGKNKPKLYLDAEVRKGISSFSALANAGEVEQGLSKLKSDLETGRFEAVKEQFENDLGDYLFIIAQKC
jgi:ubiquinone/menaquinone biosynthesis C-methylase UbiE